MELDLRKMPFQEAYKLLIGAVIPRPIAWVSTVNSTGTPNLAPFSFFNAICGNPPSLLFCPSNRPDGSEKDTLKNVRATRQFVVSLVSEDLVELMNQTSADYPEGVSEFVEAGVRPAPCRLVRAPRVENSPLSFECELIQIVDVEPVGQGGSGHVVLGKVLYAHVRDPAIRDGKLLWQELKPVARLGGPNYAPVREVFSLERPKSR